ncbi:hypothetical protein HPB49_007046 [Dermacentor silvarum]|uniref:Uncharacterized protein n=1 Tax=Dermacentor silvarum TaxID=543639 RepID=A0ACB8D3N9_DERSI|nr:hypothetical protein HPB49_007046 [Dermacentor silvarum]
MKFRSHSSSASAMGLVNGAVGVLQEIELWEGNACDTVRLWIQFDVPRTGGMVRTKPKPLAQAACRRGIKIKTEWVPIKKLRAVTVTVDRKTGLACRRRQSPVVQANAFTVQKSQGATYSDVVHEYDRRHPQELVHVALSIGART